MDGRGGEKKRGKLCDNLNILFTNIIWSKNAIGRIARIR